MREGPGLPHTTAPRAAPASARSQAGPAARVSCHPGQLPPQLCAGAEAGNLLGRKSLLVLEENSKETLPNGWRWQEGHLTLELAGAVPIFVLSQVLFLLNHNH